jgi:chromosome segregation ATPase
VEQATTIEGLRRDVAAKEETILSLRSDFEECASETRRRSDAAEHAVTTRGLRREFMEEVASKNTEIDRLNTEIDAIVKAHATQVDLQSGTIRQLRQDSATMRTLKAKHRRLQSVVDDRNSEIATLVQSRTAMVADCNSQIATLVQSRYAMVADHAWSDAGFRDEIAYLVQKLNELQVQLDDAGREVQQYVSTASADKQTIVELRSTIVDRCAADLGDANLRDDLAKAKALHEVAAREVQRLLCEAGDRDKAQSTRRHVERAPAVSKPSAAHLSMAPAGDENDIAVAVHSPPRALLHELSPNASFAATPVIDEHTARR